MKTIVWKPWMIKIKLHLKNSYNYERWFKKTLRWPVWFIKTLMNVWNKLWVSISFITWDQVITSEPDFIHHLGSSDYFWARFHSSPGIKWLLLSQISFITWDQVITSEPDFIHHPGPSDFFCARLWPKNYSASMSSLNFTFLQWIYKM